MSSSSGEDEDDHHLGVGQDVGENRPGEALAHVGVLASTKSVRAVARLP
jgi:hypothetical protein